MKIITKYISIYADNLKHYKGQIKPIVDEPVLIFDIDDTLYKSNDEMHRVEIDCWYEAYKSLYKGELISRDEVKDILFSSSMFGANLYKILGKTAKEVEDRREFEKYYPIFIKRNDILLKTLQNIPFRKWCFTNGLKCRAQGILKCLDMEDIFEGVICIDDSEMGETGKPSPYSYEFVEKLLGIENKKMVYFFDDSQKNIEGANNFGWNAIQVEKEDDIVYLIENVFKTFVMGPER